VFRSERRFCYENYKDYPERRKNFHCFGFKGGKADCIFDLTSRKRESRRGGQEGGTGK